MKADEESLKSLVGLNSEQVLFHLAVKMQTKGCCFDLQFISPTSNSCHLLQSIRNSGSSPVDNCPLIYPFLLLYLKHHKDLFSPYFSKLYKPSHHLNLICVYMRYQRKPIFPKQCFHLLLYGKSNFLKHSPLTSHISTNASMYSAPLFFMDCYTYLLTDKLGCFHKCQNFANEL